MHNLFKRHLPFFLSVLRLIITIAKVELRRYSGKKQQLTASRNRVKFGILLLPSYTHFDNICGITSCRRQWPQIKRKTVVIISLVKFPHSPILLSKQICFPMEMYCFFHCFLQSRTECIMQYGAVQKFYHFLQYRDFDERFFPYHVQVDRD